MPTKAKKPQSPKIAKKIYVTSQVFCSDNMLNEIKDLCEREKTSYRMAAPSESVKHKKFKPNCELVEKMQKVVGTNKDGEMKEMEISFKFWDEPGFAYYIQPTTLEEFENFIVECDEYGFDTIIRYYDPENLEDFEEKWISSNIGISLPEEPFGVAILQDAFLMEEDGDDDFEEGGCGDPSCPDCGNQDD